MAGRSVSNSIVLSLQPFPHGKDQSNPPTAQQVGAHRFAESACMKNSAFHQWKEKIALLSQRWFNNIVRLGKEQSNQLSSQQAWVHAFVGTTCSAGGALLFLLGQTKTRSSQSATDGPSDVKKSPNYSDILRGKLARVLEAEALGSEKKMRSLKLTELKALRGRRYDMLLNVLLRGIPPYSPNSATKRKSPMSSH